MVNDSDKSKQLHIVLNGTDKGMPSWQAMNDTELAAVVTYTKNHWSNNTGQLVQPADVAAAVAFLASPDGRYITGATVNVDGGFTI